MTTSNATMPDEYIASLPDVAPDARYGRPLKAIRRVLRSFPDASVARALLR
jgi:hypothetical protein